MSFKEQYFNLWATAWNFHKKYSNSNVSNADEFWERLVNESGEIMQQYENQPQYDFVKDLILAVISEIERIDKSRRQQEDKKNEKEIQD